MQQKSMTVVTSDFCKATFSGVIEHKFALLCTLLHRSFSMYSSCEKCYKEIVLLKDIFKRMNILSFLLITV